MRVFVRNLFVSIHAYVCGFASSVFQILKDRNDIKMRRISRISKNTRTETEIRKQRDTSLISMLPMNPVQHDVSFSTSIS